MTKKIVIIDYNTKEVHIFELPFCFYKSPDKFVYMQFSQEGQTFTKAHTDFMVVDLKQSKGRVPLYIH